MNQKTACPCCGYLTLEDEPGHFDICPVCFWEDDPIQRDNDLYDGGANVVSLQEARRNYLAFGASEERRKQHVRPPLPDEQV